MPAALLSPTAPVLLPAPAPMDAGLALLEGDAARLGQAEADLVLDAASRGMDALLVSGDNRLDALGLLARARARGLEDAVADGVVLARAFTVHQLAALVEEALPRMARERPPGRVGVALVTGLLEPFRDEDVRPGEARVLLPRLLRTLSAWSLAARVPAVATFTPGPYADVARAAKLPVRRVADAPRPAAARTLDEYAEAA